MKQVILFIVVLIMAQSCSKSIRRNDFFYFSGDHYAQQTAEGLTHTKINGTAYTCWCSPKFVKKHYTWEDKVLVAVIPKKNNNISRVEFFK